MYSRCRGGLCSCSLQPGVNVFSLKPGVLLLQEMPDGSHFVPAQHTGTGQARHSAMAARSGKPRLWRWPLLTGMYAFGPSRQPARGAVRGTSVVERGACCCWLQSHSGCGMLHALLQVGAINKLAIGTGKRERDYPPAARQSSWSFVRAQRPREMNEQAWRFMLKRYHLHLHACRLINSLSACDQTNSSARNARCL